MTAFGKPNSAKMGNKFKWDAEADRKLFYSVMIQKKLTFGNDDHTALAAMMGEGCTAGGIRNRLSNLKTKLNREGLASTAASTTARGAVNLTPKRSTAAGSGTPRAGRSKQAKPSYEDNDDHHHDDDDDEEFGYNANAVDKIVHETMTPTKKRKTKSDISIHEDHTANQRIKREKQEQKPEHDSFSTMSDVPAADLKDLDAMLGLANDHAAAEEDLDDEELYYAYRLYTTQHSEAMDAGRAFA